MAPVNLLEVYMRNLMTTAILSLSLGVSTALAQARDTSCYSQRVPMPPVRSQTILLVDLTTPASDSVVSSFRQAVMAAARTPGQRFVVLSFAGIGPTEHLTKHLDQVVEAPISDGQQIEGLPIRAFNLSQACVRDALKAWPGVAAAAIADVFADTGRKGFQRSEIVYALGETLRGFAAPGVTTRLLVHSDGLQHSGPGGMSFYGPDKQPRKIVASDELRRLPSQSPVPGAVTVLWWGLLVGGGAASGYLDSGMLDQLGTFWSETLKRWGAADVQIGQTLVNPRLHWPANDAPAIKPVSQPVGKSRRARPT